MVDRRDAYSAGASKEDFDMPAGYEGLHGMIRCERCDAFAQYKPNLDQVRCPACGHDLRE